MRGYKVFLFLGLFAQQISGYAQDDCKAYAVATNYLVHNKVNHFSINSQGDTIFYKSPVGKDSTLLRYKNIKIDTTSSMGVRISLQWVREEFESVYQIPEAETWNPGISMGSCVVSLNSWPKEYKSITEFGSGYSWPRPDSPMDSILIYFSKIWWVDENKVLLSSAYNLDRTLWRTFFLMERREDNYQILATYFTHLH